jgi:hypothetical protein
MCRRNNRHAPSGAANRREHRIHDARRSGRGKHRSASLESLSGAHDAHRLRLTDAEKVSAGVAREHALGFFVGHRGKLDAPQLDERRKKRH